MHHQRIVAEGPTVQPCSQQQRNHDPQARHQPQRQRQKTAALKAAFGKAEIANALIIDGAELNQNFALAARNIPLVDVLPVQGINVYDILRRSKLVLTKAAVEALEARFA